MHQRFPNLPVRVVVESKALEEILSDVEILFLARSFVKEFFARAPKLKWLHLAGAGIDRLLPLSDLKPDVVITHSPGIAAFTMAEYVIGVMVMLVEFPAYIRKPNNSTLESAGP